MQTKITTIPIGIELQLLPNPKRKESLILLLNGGIVPLDLKHEGGGIVLGPTRWANEEAFLDAATNAVIATLVPNPNDVALIFQKHPELLRRTPGGQCVDLLNKQRTKEE